MVAVPNRHSVPTLVVALTLAFACSAATAVAQDPDGVTVSRPDRWFIASADDAATNEPATRMLYLGRDGTVLIVQCAARDGRRTGGWAFLVRRDDWSFPTEFVEGWWSVDSEPLNGPLRWGGSGPIVMLNEDALRERLLVPVESQIRFRVTRGASEWNLEFGVRGLDQAVERFAPSCQTT
jgi:hypothetical protein